jgi:hypothetical protein
MIAAGAAELATPNTKPPSSYYRELAGVVWRAMLYRVDR